MEKKWCTFERHVFLPSTKKIKFFFKMQYQKNSMGRVSQKLIKLNTFLVWQKFLPEFSAGNFENRPSQNFVPKSSPPFVVLNLDQKKKSYVILKSVDAKFSKNAFTTPIENEGGEFDSYCLACDAFLAF